jgi:thiol:disulfide interchange protein DsbD
MKLTLTALILFSGFTLFAQSQKVKWDYSYDSENKVVHLKATLAEGWHLYSQHIANDIGPVPTTFTFDQNSSVKLVGKVDEPKPIQKYDENFEALLDYFEVEADFTQRVSFKSETTLSGTVTFMACNATMCLPPVDEKFTIELTKH